MIRKNKRAFEQAYGEEKSTIDEVVHVINKIYDKPLKDRGFIIQVDDLYCGRNEFITNVHIIDKDGQFVDDTEIRIPHKGENRRYSVLDVESMIDTCRDHIDDAIEYERKRIGEIIEPYFLRVLKKESSRYTFDEEPKYDLYSILMKLNDKDSDGEWHPIFGQDFQAIWESNDGSVQASVISRQRNIIKNRKLWEVEVYVNNKRIVREKIVVDGDSLEEQMDNLSELLKEMYVKPSYEKSESKILERKKMVEANSRELRKIKNAIYSDPEVKRLTSKVFQDDTWRPFYALIKAIDNIDGVNGVLYGDNPDPYYQNGYKWKDGKMVSKSRVITIETDFGDIKGYIDCYGAGTVEDPMSAYDMVIGLW